MVNLPDQYPEPLSALSKRQSQWFFWRRTRDECPPFPQGMATLEREKGEIKNKE
jgi:hypothetical protein